MREILLASDTNRAPTWEIHSFKGEPRLKKPKNLDVRRLGLVAELTFVAWLSFCGQNSLPLEGFA